MLFAIVFIINAAGNFAFGVAISAFLGPAEFGRYSTVAILASTLSGAAFDWIRQSALRFSGDPSERQRIAASLDAGYLAVMALLYTGAVACALTGHTFGLSTTAFLLTPLLTVALSRVDLSGALFRARNQARPFAWLFGLRQSLAFTAVLATAYFTRNATATLIALAVCTFIPPVAIGAALRTPGARIANASAKTLLRFLVYAKPIVASLVILQMIILINRQVALHQLGPEATGQLSLASDLTQRMFLALNSLPEFMLFQYALKREREEGRAAAEKQIGVNIVLTLGLLLPLTAGFMVMVPTFERLLVPAAYHGDFARLAVDLAPGFLMWCAVSSVVNPIFQLRQKTWPLTLAALGGLGVNLGLLEFTDAAASVDGLARATSIGLGVGFVLAAALALRQRAIRPSARDLAVIVLASGVMAYAVRPLNALHSPAVAALAAIVVGGAIYGGVVLAFDVAGLRQMLAAKFAHRLPFGQSREKAARSVG